MSEFIDAGGPYILWTAEGGHWVPKSFNTIKEALEADRYTSQYILTKLVNYKVVELPYTPVER